MKILKILLEELQECETCGYHLFYAFLYEEYGEVKFGEGSDYGMEYSMLSAVEQFVNNKKDKEFYEKLEEELEALEERRQSAKLAAEKTMKCFSKLDRKYLKRPKNSNHSKGHLRDRTKVASVLVNEE